MNEKINNFIADKRTAEEFLQFIGNLPALFWNYHRDTRKIDFLNSCKISPLEHREKKFLEDLVFAQSLCVSQDFFRLKMFVQSMRQGQPALSVLRVTDSKGQLFWLKLYGAPLPGNSNQYFGYVMEITESISTIHFLMRKELEAEAAIEQFDYPVILAELQNLRLIARNSPAKEFFAFESGNLRDMTISGLLRNIDKDNLAAIYEQCLTEGKWEGLLSFSGTMGNLVWGDAVLKKLSLKNKELLKLSIFNVRETPEIGLSEDASIDTEIRKKAYAERLCAKVSGESDIETVLDILLADQFYPGQFEAMLLLTPVGKKYRVYLAGQPFKGQNPDSFVEFAQPLIESVTQPEIGHRIVGDAFESTDPLDWALFIPFGIRSYFTNPIYKRQKLKGVVVLCSTGSDAFSPDDIDIYSLIEPALHETVFPRKNLKKNNIDN